MHGVQFLLACVVKFEQGLAIETTSLNSCVET